FRIELGEIEAQLCAQAGVDSALVVAREIAGSQQLVGYIKPEESYQDKADSEELRNAFIAEIVKGLRVTLPEYMMPKGFMVVSDWPLTPNGKIDKSALLSPNVSGLHEEYVAPNNDIETMMCEIWSDLLNISRDIGVKDNFFNIGGNSLLITRLQGKLKDAFGVEMAINTLFNHPTIAEQASVLEVYWKSNESEELHSEELIEEEL
ncbi:phosphopantetheine-binding protein, partial [Alteromonas sp. ASW11-130]|uniref:phosphopantetheine-binding protein n=1 Tax=Alteromonas sp. ASW11-130 TaxID=3015775 RepID=UPI002242920F